MVAAGVNGSSQRLDSALVARMPEPIDIVNDIFIPGRVEAFKSTLVAALQSRKLLWVIQERAPTLQDVINWNAPLLQTNQISTQDCSDALDTMIATRQATIQSLASLLPALLKSSSLSYLQVNGLNAMVAVGDGIGIHDFIQSNLYLRQGVVQDKLRPEVQNTMATILN